MAQRVQIILEDDYDGEPPTRRSVSHSTARSMKSTSPPRMRQGSETRWRRGWHTPARPAAGGGARRRRRARRAPATSAPGHRPKASMSAAAAGSRQKYGMRTRKLTSSLSWKSLAPAAFGKSSS